MPTPEQDAYLKTTFGLDATRTPQDPATTGLVQTAGTDSPQAPPPTADAGSPVPHPTPAPPPSTPPPTPPSDAGSPPPTPPPPTPITLRHQTVASTPGNRARTRIGVGEQVTLTVQPGPGTWLVSGGTLNTGTGATVVLTARDTAGAADVSVNVNGQTASASFTVVAPASVAMTVSGTRHAANGRPNGAIQTEVFIGPADVSFRNIKTLELEIGAVASGYWAGANGQGHGPNASPLAMEGTVVAGKGTKCAFNDNCAIWGGGPSPPWQGTCVYSIPWQYKVGNGSLRNFATVTQSMNSDASGALTVSKGGASHTFALGDGESSYAGAPY